VQACDLKLNDLTLRLLSIFKKYRVLRAIVFGSLARGEESRHSDLDLLVIQETNERFLDRYDGLLSEIVRAVPGRDVDLLVYTPGELSQMAQQPLVATILREGRTIYESEQKSLPGREVAADC